MKVYIIPCLSLFILGLSQQALFSQEILKKEMIYTLNTNEVVAQEENSLDIQQDELTYIVVTANVKDFSRTYHINGKSYGPFDRRLMEKPFFNLDSWGFIDSKDETSYVIFNGEEIGVHQDPLYPVGLKVASNSWSYVLIDQLEGSTRVIINGQEYGPFNFLKDYHISSDGTRWAIVYNDEPNQYYVLFNNGKRIGPYANIINFRFLEGRGNRWVMTCEMPGVLPKTINGKEVKQFSIISNNREVGVFEEALVSNADYDFRDLISEGDNYGQAVIQDQKIFFIANDQLYGPYNAIPNDVDMGKDFNKFNYIDPSTNTLHFKGDGIFARNVKHYYVSDSRKSVAVIKSAAGGKDSLSINDKYFKGIFDKIEYLRFAPESEEWAMLSNKNGNYTLHLSDGRKFGPFPIDTQDGHPDILLGKGAKNWALYYRDRVKAANHLLVNNQERKDEFIGKVAMIKEGDQEYFSWFSLEEKTVYLNKLLLE